MTHQPELKHVIYDHWCQLAPVIHNATAERKSELRHLPSQRRAELEAEHEADLEAQKQAAAADLKQVEEKTQAEIARNIRSRLLQLATRKRS